ncbi:NADPH-dependent F420 reductase [Streptomyces fuscichromogenes]|uniref:NADP oxidoreductase n=1 Tax=Streptomyces fuscichromogenes TaxID=1324013 RepID=A0A917X9L0_9ACTN|nr:NADPH-dependent F420 reductase [Streptomyces fuscichromogenes]GGM97634.1 NADP oxidoreductase [Streptomyces fuscichromogenes]
MTTRTLAVIGSGMIGGALAGLAVKARLQVLVTNSRGPETLADLVARLGTGARAVTVEEAVEAGELVAAAIPFRNHAQLPAESLAGRTVIDAMNYYPERDGRITALDSSELTSSELTQRHLSRSHVVKAFNNIDFHRLATSARPAGAPDRSALPIAGDDPSAKQAVSRLLDALGYDAVDIGTLSQSRPSQPGTPVYVQPYMAERPEGLSRQDAQRWFFDTPGVPVSAEEVRELVARGRTSDT